MSHQVTKFWYKLAALSALVVLIVFFSLPISAVAEESSQGLLYDKDEIRDVIWHYPYYVNDADVENNMMSLFSKEPVLEFAKGQGATYYGHDAVQEFYEKNYGRWKNIRNTITNILIDVKGNTATATAHFDVVLVRPRLTMWVKGDYHYDFVQEEGKWRIDHLLIDNKFSRILP